MNKNELPDRALMALQDVLETQLFLDQFAGSASSPWYEDNEELLAQQLEDLWQALSALADWPRQLRKKGGAVVVSSMPRADHRALVDLFPQEPQGTSSLPARAAAPRCCPPRVPPRYAPQR